MSDLRELGLRVCHSKYRELHLWKNTHVFTLGIGTAASSERWYLQTPQEDYYGDSLEEVFSEAERNYPEIRSWIAEFGKKDGR